MCYKFISTVLFLSINVSLVSMQPTESTTKNVLSLKEIVATRMAHAPCNITSLPCPKELKEYICEVKFPQFKWHLYFSGYPVSRALHHAAFDGNIELITILLDLYKVPVDARDSEEMTPLMWAAIGNKYDAVELLLDRNAQVCLRDFHRFTALLYAERKGYRKIVHLLEEYIYFS